MESRLYEVNNLILYFKKENNKNGKFIEIT